MKIALGADHAGVEMKTRLREDLEKAGHEVRDFGTDSLESTDYPDYAQKVAEMVAGGEADRGILVCGTGAGMAIAANKVHGVRAAVGVDPDQVALLRSHNNANILTFGARFTNIKNAANMMDVFLTTPFAGGRHERRIEKIAHLEEAK